MAAEGRPTLSVVTAARNEGEFLPQLADSMLSQKRLPDSWCIIDDGSEDDTPKIVAGLAKRHSWIFGIQKPDRGFYSRGPGNISALNEGITATKNGDRSQLVAIMDADVSFDDTATQQIEDSFQSRWKLGIYGGEIVEAKDGDWAPPVVTPPDFVRGAFKVYRRACLEEINGIRPIKGWSVIDNMTAQMRGWEVERDPDLEIKHHRPKGTRDGIGDHRKAARNAYFVDSDPALVIARGLRRMIREKPLVLGGLAFLGAYFKSKVSKDEQYPDEELLKFVRQRHRQVLLDGYIDW